MRYTDSSTLTLEFSTVLSTPTVINLLYKILDILITPLLKGTLLKDKCNVLHRLFAIIFLIVTWAT